MSMSDPIADMLTRVRNAQMAEHSNVTVPASKLKTAIAKVLKDEGYIASYQVEDKDGKPQLNLELKYYQGKPVIEMLKRISKPSLKVYVGKDELPSVNGGLGVAIVSTSNGVMSGQSAKEAGVGGEVLCNVY